MLGINHLDGVTANGQLFSSSFEMLRTHEENITHSTTARKQATVERLSIAIASLKAKKREISVQTIFEECGLCYAAIPKHWLSSEPTVPIWWRKRNEPGANMTKVLRTHHPLVIRSWPTKKPRLVERMHTAEQRLLDVQQQLAVQIAASMQREARIAELEAKLAELEPYRTFVEQMRAQMQREERGRFGDLPPGL